MQREIGPLNDFIFKQILGKPGCEKELLVFLNAIMAVKKLPTFKSVTISNEKELPKEHFDDKLGIIDVKAKSSENEIINIEIQLTNQKNMEKRTMFYWSKLYYENVTKGKDYKYSKKVVTINILDFDYYPSHEFHLLFKALCVDEPDLCLSDVLEVHFIQLPKFYAQTKKDLEHNQLHRYLLYFQKQIDDDLLKELITMDENIAKINERYDRALSDEETKTLAWERERALIERNSIYSAGVDEGIEQGEKSKALEIAKNLLDVLDNETIAIKTGLDLLEIEALR